MLGKRELFLGNWAVEHPRDQFAPHPVFASHWQVELSHHPILELTIDCREIQGRYGLDRLPRWAQEVDGAYAGQVLGKGGQVDVAIAAADFCSLYASASDA